MPSGSPPVSHRARHLHTIMKLLGQMPVVACDQGSLRRDVAAERAGRDRIGLALEMTGDLRVHGHAEDVLSDFENFLAGAIGKMRIERTDAAPELAHIGPG